jgi:hypothetical protein
MTTAAATTVTTRTRTVHQAVMQQCDECKKSPPVRIHTYTPIHIYSYRHILIHTYTHTYTHTLIHSYTHTLQGGVFGEADFMLDRRHTVKAFTLSSSCLFWVLDRESFVSMELENPRLCTLIQYTLLKSLAMAHTCSQYAAHSNS